MTTVYNDTYVAALASRLRDSFCIAGFAAIVQPL